MPQAGGQVLVLYPLSFSSDFSVQLLYRAFSLKRLHLMAENDTIRVELLGDTKIVGGADNETISP